MKWSRFNKFLAEIIKIAGGIVAISRASPKGNPDDGRETCNQRAF